MGSIKCCFSLDLYQLSPTALLTFLYHEARYWGVHTSSEQAVLLGPRPPLTGRPVGTVLADRPIFRSRYPHFCAKWPFFNIGLTFFKSLSGQTGAQVMGHQAQDTSKVHSEVSDGFASPSTASGDLLSVAQLKRLLRGPGTS